MSALDFDQLTIDPLVRPSICHPGHLSYLLRSVLAPSEVREPTLS